MKILELQLFSKIQTFILTFQYPCLMIQSMHCLQVLLLFTFCYQQQVQVFLLFLVVKVQALKQLTYIPSIKIQIKT